MRVSILTFGCRVNQAESLAIERDLRAAGAEVVQPADADLVIVNSCSVTATADQGTRQSVRRVARDNPSAQIVVTGCYATRSPEEVAALPNVVQLVPNERKDTLVPEIRRHRPRVATRDACHQRAACSLPLAAVIQHPTFDNRHSLGPDPWPLAPATVLRVGSGGRTAFTLRVQNGCEEPCSYCIIPTTRGASHSTPPDAVVRELQRVEGAGFKEVTLTGVHLGSYGRDLDRSCTLDGLLARALAGTRSLVLRLGSLEPMDCTRALIDLASRTDRLAPAFHLPLQHASDRMLTAMRRPYTLAQYEATVTALHERIPHASIGSDILVGFPGETDDDARRLMEWLAGSPLTSLHVFPYSDRPGTEASALRPKVRGEAIRARAAAVRSIGQDLQARFRASLVGTVHRALTIEDGSVAVTGNGLKVRIGAGVGRNEWVRVRVAGDGCAILL